VFLVNCCFLCARFSFLKSLTGNGISKINFELGGTCNLNSVNQLRLDESTLHRVPETERVHILVLLCERSFTVLLCLVSCS